MYNIRFVCAQPANTYYLWQVEVMINNFIKHGINPNKIDILCAINNNIIPDDWKKLQNHYNTVRFFFYNDTRTDSCYIPSIYFHLLSKHLTEHPELQDAVLFTHDSDIVFTKLPNLNSLYPKKWYVADTHTYLDYDYIQSKGDEIYQQMCKIVGIDPLIPKIMGKNIGGAQYIVSKTTPEFWNKVEKDSVALYKYFCQIEPHYQKKHNGDYPIQKWTAGMWSYMWNGWLAGNEIIVEPTLGFAWSTDSIESTEKYSILHNAGVVDSNSGMFYKGAYINKLPYNEVLQIDESKASSYYWNEICETAKISPLTNKS
jgi:hypothetical protein